MEAAVRASSWRLLSRVGERQWALRSVDDSVCGTDAAEAGARCVPGDGTRDKQREGALGRGEDAANSSGARSSGAQDAARVDASGARALVGCETDVGAAVLPGDQGRDALRPRVDLGAIAKGYTADACRDLAVSMGARGVLVSVGTSSVSHGGLACGTLAVCPRPSLASWNFPWVIWRPCQRPATTWGRWAALAPRATASVGLLILLMIMLASAHPSTAMPLVPSMVAAGLVAASQ